MGELALSPVPRRHAVLLAKHPAEMRQVVKAPGEGDLADMAVRQHRRGQVALAMRQPLGQHMALERGVLIREQVVDIARRNSERGGGRCEAELGIGEASANMRFEPKEQGRAMGRRGQGG